MDAIASPKQKKKVTIMPDQDNEDDYSHSFISTPHKDEQIKNVKKRPNRVSMKASFKRFEFDFNIERILKGNKNLDLDEYKPFMKQFRLFSQNLFEEETIFRKIENPHL